MKEIEIKLRKLITGIFLYLIKAEKSTGKVTINSESRVLFINLNRIGDALVSTPLIGLVKRKTNCYVGVLAGAKNHFVFDTNPYVNKTIRYSKGIVASIKLTREISKDYDVIVDLHDGISTTVSLIIGLSKVPIKVGLEKGNEKIYSHTAPKLDPSKSHVVDRILQLSSLMGLDSDLEKMKVDYNYSEISEEIVNNFISDNFDNPAFLVGINISAGSDARFWGVKRFKSLLGYFEKDKTPVVIISALKDLSKAEEISNSKYAVFCSPSFDEFAALISKLDFLFTPDTSAVHLASAYNVPTFAIYARYQTNDLIWTPYNTTCETVTIEAPDFSELNFETVQEKLKIFYRKIKDSNASDNSLSEIVN
ncbi:MAG: glycosyltransferase family 9 protein [Bacteroidetes bacterium]|nr:glycosyltransferase family 9 protein [Bacteroidota bacterium]